MSESKAAAYLGFARRAGKLTLGVNAALTVKKCFLMVADNAVGKNSRKEIEKLKEKFSCPLVYCDNLGDMVAKPGCMLALVREEHLARAAYDALRQN